VSTYSASHRVNGSDHLLNGRLWGYCRGHVPRVLWVVGYGPKNLDMTRLPLAENGWGVTRPVQGMVPPLLAKGKGQPTKRDLNPSPICTSPFPPLDSNG
jgi:hypothetical protein